jgi:hypothetical protein
MTKRVWSIGGSSLARAAFLAFAAGFAGSALAQDAETEKQKLAQCEVDICRMIVEKTRDGGDLSCDLTKTWQQEDIEKGAQEKKLTWGFGRARCNVKIDIKRTDIVDAVTQPSYTLKVEKQPVECEIERNEEQYPIKMTLAPVLTFKDGKATQADLGVNDIEGTTVIKGVVWTAATLEQNFGLFQADILKEVNKFIATQCPRRIAGK